MKFTALLKKELRECLPWLLLASVVFFGFGAVLMKGALYNQQYRIEQGYNLNEPMPSFNLYESQRSPINEFGPLLLTIAIALGIVLAVRQFLLPGFFKTWAFTIHRSIKPLTILWTKFTAAAITFTASIGLLWMLFYSYAAVPGRFFIPVFFKTCLEGWMYILLGVTAYFGIALSALSTTRWYTTRLLGVAVAFVVFITALSTSMQTAMIWTLAASAILVILIVHTFLTREY